MGGKERETELTRAIRERRDELGLKTNTEFAKLLGVNSSTFNDWASGRKQPSAANKRLLGDKGGVPIPPETDTSELEFGMGIADGEQGSPRPTPEKVDAHTEVPYGPPRMREADQTKDVLESFIQESKRKAVLGQVPLLILGSGVSAPRVPRLPKLAELLGIHLSKLQESRPVKRLRALAESVAVMDDDRSSVTLADVTQLFSAASQLEVCKSAWRAFSLDLILRGNEKVDMSDGIIECKPTGGHQAIARLLSQRLALCMSLNFDRLTWRALRDKTLQAVILHHSKEITRYYCADTSVFTPAILKIRGDVLSLRCDNPACPASVQPQPLPEKGLTENDTKDGIRCPDCGGGPLVVDLSFPGERKKEEAATEALEAFRSHIAGTLSSIIFVGLSGRWDVHVLNWARDYAQDFDVPIVHVKKRDRSSYIRNHYLAFDPGSSQSAGCHVLVLDKDSFLKKFCDELSTMDTHAVPWKENRQGIEDVLDLNEFEDSGVWLNGSGRIEVAGPEDSPVGVSVDTSDFADVVVARQTKTYLHRLAQLGLVDDFIGHSRTHSRWEHSRGTAIVGTLWAKHLSKYLVRLRPDGKKPFDCLLVLLKHALLIHDCGHLPFSHMLERVLSQINWLPGESDDLQMEMLYARLCREQIDRKHNTQSVSFRKMLKYIYEGLEALSGMKFGTPKEGKDYVARLLLTIVSGRAAWPWVSVIANSPIDADKIDYLTRDRLEFAKVQHNGYIGGRLGQRMVADGRANLAWLTDFLCEQNVTPHGAIALSGKSAVAAADLWQQRLLAYRRIYYAPEFRVYERMATEILEQYVIRYIMGMHEAWDSNMPMKLALASLYGSPTPAEGTLNWDLRPVKAHAVAQHLENLVKMHLGGLTREKEPFIATIVPNLLQNARIPYDSEYQTFMEELVKILSARLNGAKDWPCRSLDYVVGEPIRISTPKAEELQELLRPIQHRCSTSVLVDILGPQKALAGPATGILDGKRVFGHIIVPTGPAGRWRSGLPARVPLTDSAVDGMEDNSTQLLVISPYGKDSPEARWAFDRIQAICKDAGYHVEESE